MNMRLNLGGVKDLELKKVFGPEYYVCNLQGVPTSLEEALSSSDSGFWKEAVNDEMDSIISNNTLKLVDLPPGCKTIGYKRVLIRKLKPDGSIENLKPDGSISKQIEDIDFFDTFSSITKVTSIRLLIAIAAIHNLMIHQMDVKTAFLNGELEEEIYMDQP